VTVSEEFHQLIVEFKESFASTEAGQRHLKAYASAREAGRANFKLVCDAADSGQDVTDQVLLKLLPHWDTPYNREHGAWLHFAPVVTRSVKLWFEKAGWASPEKWPELANRVLQFVRSVNENSEGLAAACEEFSMHTKGVQSAFLSPILNALRPSEFLIVNSKTLKTLAKISGPRFDSKLNSYPSSNAAQKELLKEVQGEFTSIGDGFLPGDILDAFAHWFVAIRPVKTNQDDDLDRLSPDVAAAWFARKFPDEIVRRRCETFLVSAIEQAHPLGTDRWRVILRKPALRLVVGKLVAFHLAADRVRIGLIPGHLSAEVRHRLEEVGHWRREHSTTPLSVLADLPIETFLDLEAALAPNFTEFLAVAASTVKKTIEHKSHSPGVIEYLQKATGRTIPQPTYEESTPGVPTAMPKAVALTTARALFNKVDYELSHLLSAIDTGDIGLPDLQRPFVWSHAKVRDLFDSMYRGFPIGYLLFWSNSQLRNARSIGTNAKQQKIPRLVIVDGQQRLTSLYAVLRAKLVLDDNFEENRIEIGFRPRDGKFEVTDAAIRKDPEFIPSISEMWASGTTSWSVVNKFLAQLKAKRTLDADDEGAMSHNIDRLFALHGYSLTALEIVADVEEEEIADIFVRINSEGVKLNQADFILTLLSVFWQEGRLALEEFSRLSRIPPAAAGKPSSFNYLIQPSPDQLLRVGIATGFHRARLRRVYQVLRGKDVDTGEFLQELRDAQFDRLRVAQSDVLDLNNWHDYLSCLTMAGYRSAEMISSQIAVLYAYAIYLIGKLQCDVPHYVLHRLIGRWFVMTSLSARYTGGETTMEEDLNRLRSLQTPDAFTTLLEGLIGNILTADFWSIRLPAELESSSPRNPAFLAYQASQCLLGAPVLFSDKRVADVLDPALRPRRKSIDRHHLFPKAWLQRSGIADFKLINQVANFAYVEWPDNLSIKDSPPREYVPRLREQFSEHKWIRMCRENALPPAWEELAYDDFLQRRRALMAQVIQNGFDSIGKTETSADGATVEQGTASEQTIWRTIESVELELRKVIRRRFTEKWGAGADTRMSTILGPPALEVIERNRTKYQTQYRSAERPTPDPILDFSYLGQLVQLMIDGNSWDLFKAAFVDKRELQDLAKAISLVRNDRAHFRSVPELELLRCQVAVSDLAARLRSLDEPQSQESAIGG
jgi:hypothetical protein